MFRSGKKCCSVCTGFFLLLVCIIFPISRMALAGSDNELLLAIPSVLAKSTSNGNLTVVKNGDILSVRSSKAPSWKVEFAIGSGAPGGGLATALYIPEDNPESIVEPTPFLACCSAVGLDNLEWRWREYGGSVGTRAAMGLVSEISSFTVVADTSEKFVFTLTGNWTGVSEFIRTTTVTPDGYTTSVQAVYSGTTGKDSMWWVISLLHPDKIFADKVTVRDADTSPVRITFTQESVRPLPAGITLPYRFEFPLQTTKPSSIYLEVLHFAEEFGQPYNYEFWDKTSFLGNNHMFYPRWMGSFMNVTYHFEWKWRFTPIK